MDDKAREALNDRITAYLAGGGLFNPELANHTAVRDLLIDCRAALQWAASQQAAEGWRFVPVEPTPEMIARAAISVLQPADRDMELAYLASHIVLTHPAAPHGISADLIAASIATMAPAYRAMIAAAPPATQGGAFLPGEYERMTENGRKAWEGVDPQDLRAGNSPQGGEDEQR